MYSSKDDRDITPLERAVRDGDAIKIKDIVEKGGLSRSTLYNLIKSALWYEEEHIARFLIEHNPRVQRHDKYIDEETLLHLACKTEWKQSLLGKNVEIAKLLLENGARVDAQDCLGRTPLHCCRDIELARILLDRGAPFDVRDKIGLTPLIRMLSNRRDAAFIRACFGLIDEYGVRPDQSEQYSLLRAWVHGDHDDEGFRELVKHGIDARTRSSSGQTVLHYAARIGQASMVGVLKRYGIDVNAVDDDGRTLMHALLDKFESERDTRTIGNDIDMLIRDNPEMDVNIKDNNLSTPLHIAIKVAEECHWLYGTGIIKSLTEHGAEIFTPMSDGKSVLPKVPSKVQFIFIDHMARHRRLMDIIDKHGNTALHAISESYISYRLSDLDNISLDGLDVNVVNKFGETPLQLASKAGRVATVEYLLNNGAGELIVGRTIDGLTPLHIASLREASVDWSIAGAAEFTNIIEAQFVQGFVIDTRDKIGKTPLHYAIESGSFYKVRQLLDKGADVNVADNIGKNSLYRAIELGSSVVLKMILDRGVDVTTRFFDGTTSLHLSIRLILHRWHGPSNTLALLEHFEKNHLDPDLLQEYDIHTPLYYAMQSYLYLPERLIRCGASVDKIYWIDGGKFLFLYLDNRNNGGIVGDAFIDLLTRLYAANLGESKYYIQSWLTDDRHRDVAYKGQCHKEVEKLRSSEISAQMSYYDFLHNADPFLSKTISTTEPDFDKLAGVFPIYAGLIKSKIEADLYRVKLLPSATDELSCHLNRSSYLRDSSLPVEVVSRILTFLDNQDLLTILGLDIGNRSIIHYNPVDGDGYRRVGKYIFPIHRKGYSSVFYPEFKYRGDCFSEDKGEYYGDEE